MPDRSAQPRRRRARSAFTLTEMLVILGVIIIILAIALPAFNAVQGSRSVEAGQNIVSASLGRARAEAIRRGVTCGAYFFVDLEGRTNVAFVAVGNASSDPDPYDEYKAFAAEADYQGANNDPLPGSRGEPAMTADRVIALVADGNGSGGTGDYIGNYAGYVGRPVVASFEPKFNPADPSAMGAPGMEGVDPPIMPNGGTTAVPLRGTFRTDGDETNRANAYWGAAGADTELILLADIPVETLPAGVGLQIITGAALEGENYEAGAVTGAGTSGNFIERYTRVGLIAFDRTGRLVQADYRVTANSPLGEVMAARQLYDQNADATSSVRQAINGTGELAVSVGGPGTFATPPNPIQSGYGLVVYRTDEFEAAASDGTATHWKSSFFQSLSDEEPIDDFVTSDRDPTMSYPNFDPGDADVGLNPAGYSNEYAEERWLDANAEPLLVNRFSGTLVSNTADQSD